MDPLDEKWKSFGWEVRSCDGHDIAQLMKLMDQVPFVAGKPSLVLANTIKGKGVDFMESNEKWHYRAPNNEELEKAILQLRGGCR